MAEYRLKRKTKTFNVIEAAGSALGNTTGGILKGVGSVADSKVGRVGGGVLGAMTLGRTLGTVMSGVPFGGVLGTLGGYVAGKAITGGIGKGLKNAGQSLQDRSV